MCLCQSWNPQQSREQQPQDTGFTLGTPALWAMELLCREDTNVQVPGINHCAEQDLEMPTQPCCTVTTAWALRVFWELKLCPSG